MEGKMNTEQQIARTWAIEEIIIGGLSAAGGALSGLAVLAVEMARNSEANLYATAAQLDLVTTFDTRSVYVVLGSLLVMGGGLFAAVDGAGRLDALRNPDATQSA